MSARPWIKFYPADWLADSKLAACSPSAQAVWMRMLCVIARDGDPPGHMRLNGHPLGCDEIATVIGLPPRVTGEGLTELEARGVFSRIDGAICSRRMIRDEQRRVDGLRHGVKGSPPRGTGGGQTCVQPPHSEARGQRLEEEIPPTAAPVPKKKAPTGPAAEVIAYHGAKYLTAFGEKYAFAGAKDGDAVKWMLTQASGDVARVKAKIDMAFTDDWSVKAGCTLGVVRSKWSSYVNGHAAPQVNGDSDLFRRTELMIAENKRLMGLAP